MPSTVRRLFFVVVSAALSACIPTTSTSFSVDRADPLSDAKELQYVCGKLGMALFAVRERESPDGAFGCESAPAHGYFIVIKPDIEKKQINFYFAERAHSFSPDAKAIYLDLVRELQRKFGPAASNIPAI